MHAYRCLLPSVVPPAGTRKDHLGTPGSTLSSPSASTLAACVHLLRSCEFHGAPSCVGTSGVGRVLCVNQGASCRAVAAGLAARSPAALRGCWRARARVSLRAVWRPRARVVAK